jgi:adenosylhomocysteine nucleosidase
MGATSTSKAMQIIPPEMHDAWISTGLAGALDSELPLSATVVARTAMTRDETLHVLSDADFVSVATACGATVVTTFLTSEAIVASSLEKESLASTASVVEMESTHVLAAAQNRQVPAVAVRAISDVAEEDLPLDFNKIVDERGHLKVGGLLKEVALHPYRLAPLIRFGQHSRAAAVSLANFLDRYIPALGEDARRNALAETLAHATSRAASGKTGWLQ